MEKKIKRHFFIIALLFSTFISFGQQWGLYTLYATKNGAQAYLIDTSDSPVTFHTWTFNSSKKTVYSTYLTYGDTIVRSYKPQGNTWNVGPCHGGIQKVLWDGTVAWDWTYYATNQYCLHHDICPMPNGNILMISYDYKTAAEAVAAGSSSNAVYYSEKVIEVHQTGPTTGVIVWEWKLWDHMCQNTDPTKDHYVTSFIDNPQMMNINYNGTGSLPDRYHMNGIDYNPVLDQIVVSMHFMNSAFVIDHSTTTAEAAGHTGGNSGKGGDFLYRWGNPNSYGATGSTIFNVIHDAHWVPSDNPNYPNYLAGFNNNPPNFSKVDIWNPPYDGYNYSRTSGTAYEPNTFSYEFTSVFKASNEGNSQQLPNGNMLVNNSFGNVYEVNAAGTQLWTKAGTNSTHAYRYTKCYIRGPIVTASASDYYISQGTPVNLNSSANSVTETSPTYTYSWEPSTDLSDPNIADPTATPNATVTYTVTVTNTDIGCSSTASVTIEVSSGLNEITDNKNVNIFPNPTSGIVTLDWVNKADNYSVLVFDVFGKIILNEKNKNIINISQFSNGIYYMEIVLENQQIINKKLILIK